MNLNDILGESNVKDLINSSISSDEFSSEFESSRLDELSSLPSLSMNRQNLQTKKESPASPSSSNSDEGPYEDEEDDEDDGYEYDSEGDYEEIGSTGYENSPNYKQLHPKMTPSSYEDQGKGYSSTQTFSDYSRDNSSHLDSSLFTGEKAFDIANQNNNESFSSDLVLPAQKNPNLLRERMTNYHPPSIHDSVLKKDQTEFDITPVANTSITSNSSTILTHNSSQKNGSFAGSNIFSKAIEKEHSRSFGDDSSLGDISILNNSKLTKILQGHENQVRSPYANNGTTSDVIDLTSSSPTAEISQRSSLLNVSFPSEIVKHNTHTSSPSPPVLDSQTPLANSDVFLPVANDILQSQTLSPKIEKSIPQNSNGFYLADKSSGYEPNGLTPATVVPEKPMQYNLQNHLDHNQQESVEKSFDKIGEEPQDQSDSEGDSSSRIHLHSKSIRAENVRDSIALARESSAEKPATMSKSLVLSSRQKSPEYEAPHPDLLRRALSTKKVSDVRKLAFLQQAQKLNKPFNAGVTFSPIKTVKEFKIGSSPSKPQSHHKPSIMKNNHYSRSSRYNHWEDNHYEEPLSDLPSPSPSPLPTPSRGYNRESSYYSRSSRKMPVDESTPFSERDSSFSDSFASAYNSEWVDMDSQMPGEFRRQSRRSSSSSQTSDEQTSNGDHNDSAIFKARGFHNDPSVPYTLSLYLQLLLNFFLSCIFIYFFYILVTTIRHDVDKKVDEYSAEILAEMAECSKQYLRNNCMPGRRVPALENTCISWERCMNRDPTVVGRARVSAETFSEIINSFIKPLTLKTWTVIGGLMVASFVFSNAAFAVFRSNQHAYFQGPNPGSGGANSYNTGPQHPPPPPPGYNQPFTPGYPPATPYGYFTPMLKITTGKRRHRRSTYSSPTEMHSHRKRSHRP